MQITREISIEDLVETLPDAVTYLSRHGIRCILCGEPVWGTLEDAAREKGFDDKAIDAFVGELNEMYRLRIKAGNKTGS